MQSVKRRCGLLPSRSRERTYGKGAFAKRTSTGTGTRSLVAGERLHVRRGVWIVGRECRRRIVKRLRASRTSSTWGSPWFRLKKKGQPCGLPLYTFARSIENIDDGGTSIQSGQVCLHFHATQIIFSMCMRATCVYFDLLIYNICILKKNLIAS